jgi:hypothetical protein
MSQQRKIHRSCRNCKESIEVDKDSDAPKKAIGMACNWCLSCEDDAQKYYREWYLFKRKPAISTKQMKLF